MPSSTQSSPNGSARPSWPGRPGRAGAAGGDRPAELAAELENLTPAQFRELPEDFADAQAAREALAEVEAGAGPVPAEQVWAELGLGT